MIMQNELIKLPSALRAMLRRAPKMHQSNHSEFHQKLISLLRQPIVRETRKMGHLLIQNQRRNAQGNRTLFSLLPRIRIEKPVYIIIANK